MVSWSPSEKKIVRTSEDLWLRLSRGLKLIFTREPQLDHPQSIVVPAAEGLKLAWTEATGFVEVARV